ncbi:MAG: hypothetical protein RL220_1949 [Bacteroidota bacterium]
MMCSLQEIGLRHINHHMSTTFRRAAVSGLMQMVFFILMYTCIGSGTAAAKVPMLPTLNECGNDVDESGVGLGFNGYYAPGNWSVLNAPGNGTVNFSAPASVSIAGSDGISGSNILTVIETTVVVDGTFTFNWSWTTADLPQFDPAFYQIGATVFQLTNNGGANSQSGSLSFTATAGTVIRFGVNSVDGCCGAATMVVSGFGWPAACPVNECGNFVDESGQGNDFFGFYDHSNWSMILDIGDGSIDNSSNQSVVVTGSNNFVNNVKTTYFTTAQAAGTVSFSWSYTTLDSPGFDPGFVLINGVQTNLTNTSSSAQSGTFSFVVTQGMQFGFGVDATDGCCGRGTLTVTNFSWPGQCTFGCIAETACNFNPAANADDGSCLLPECADPLACSFNVNAACVDNALCIYPGCTDVAACNYNATAGCSAPDLCSYPGCNNPVACNYNPQAGCDDGSCIISPVNDVCENAILITSNFINQTASTLNTCQDSPISYLVSYNEPFTEFFEADFFNDIWYSFVATGALVQITISGNQVRPFAAIHDACGSTEALYVTEPLYSESCFCSLINSVTIPCGDLVPGQTYYIRVGGNSFITEFSPGYTPVAGSFEWTFNQQNLPGSAILGCTDEMACNFNPAAYCGDSFCVFPGCTDPVACNYNAESGCDDGSCFYPGCTDPSACNYDPLDLCKQEPCLYIDCFGICGGLGEVNACDICYSPVVQMSEFLFNYTGSEQVFVVPDEAVEIEVEAYGAQGGGALGYGGMARGFIYNPPFDTLFVYVGGMGGLGTGGFNGGGDGGSGTNSHGGGGASDVRLISGDLYSRLLVAGGGGGAYYDTYQDFFGGVGGGFVGGEGAAIVEGGKGGNQLEGGYGAVQSGSFGFGGNANSNSAGGGGGWYGGGAKSISGGGGGSGYIGGVEYGVTESGVHYGDGHVIIRVKSLFNTIDGCIPGCTDNTALNFFPMSNFDDGSCIYAGCTDVLALNYNPAANFSDNSCIYPEGCTYPDATNFNASAVIDNGTCTFDAPASCLGDLNNDAVVGVTDLLIFLSVFGTSCN